VQLEKPAEQPEGLMDLPLALLQQPEPLEQPELLAQLGPLVQPEQPVLALPAQQQPGLVPLRQIRQR
jgi:hypothetical protein